MEQKLTEKKSIKNKNNSLNNKLINENRNNQEKFQDSTTTTPGLCSLIKDSEKCYNNKKCHYDWNSSSCRDIRHC